MSFKVKKLAILSVGVVFIFIVATYIAIEKSNEALQATLQSEIQQDNKKVLEHLINIQQTLKKTATALAQDKEVISALNVVSSYQDKDDYLSIIFDVEKEALIEHLKRYFVSDSFFEVVLYDNKQELVATKKYHSSLGRTGFITYKDGERYFKSENDLVKLQENKKVSFECKEGLSINYTDGYYTMCESQVVRFGDAKIGKVAVIYYFGTKELERFQKNLTYPVSFIQQKVTTEQFDITPIDEDFNLFLKHHIDESYIEEQQKRRTAFTFVVVFLVILTIFLFLLYRHNELAKYQKALEDTNKKLKEEQERLANILEGTNAGTWEWNIQTGETIFNQRWAQMLGYTLDELEPISIDTWMKYAHPDDLEKSNRLIQKHIEGKSDFYECESRMKHKDGSWIWVLDRGKISKWDDEGKPLIMSGTHQDITQKKQAEIGLKEAKQKADEASRHKSEF
ncbi:MAG: PAS domain-containing protein, partial [Campylobacterales bacterium]